jgi:hypothetical protein
MIFWGIGKTNTLELNPFNGSSLLPAAAIPSASAASAAGFSVVLWSLLHIIESLVLFSEMSL